MPSTFHIDIASWQSLSWNFWKIWIICWCLQQKANSMEKNGMREDFCSLNYSWWTVIYIPRKIIFKFYRLFSLITYKRRIKWLHLYFQRISMSRKLFICIETLTKSYFRKKSWLWACRTESDLDTIRNHLEFIIYFFDYSQRKHTKTHENRRQCIVTKSENGWTKLNFTCNRQ